MPFAFVAPADELQIRNLIARYAYAVDGGAKEAFASLFLENGAWTRETSPSATQGGSGLPSQTIRGRAGLMDLIETAIIGRFQLKARHQMTDVVAEPGADAGSSPEFAAHICRSETAANWTACVRWTPMHNYHQSTFEKSHFRRNETRESACSNPRGTAGFAVRDVGPRRQPPLHRGLAQHD